MFAKINRYNPLRLLNSVPFGITVMSVIALYMALASGRPWLRSAGVDEWPVFRDWFDKTDLQVFNAWPLKTLMAVLVANLVVVTWRKIPLTPPRYGVWCIHAGIVTLILGAAIHYSLKVEGKVTIYADPAMGPNTVDGYYDKDERALYVRTGKDTPAMYPLPTLPRFQQYDEADGTAAALRRRAGLTGFRPTLTARDEHAKEVTENVAEMVYPREKVPAGGLSVDVVGFYPYAKVNTGFDQTDPASAVSGVALSIVDPGDPGAARDTYAVGSDPRFGSGIDAGQSYEYQHLDGDKGQVDRLAEAAAQLFHIDVTTPGGGPPASLYVRLGQTVPIGTSGYTLTATQYDPAWPKFGTTEFVHMLNLMVAGPPSWWKPDRFRRMVLEGDPVQTDFVLGDRSAGPMGKRQKRPLDPDLKVTFRVEDPFRLLPTDTAVKHTLLTPAGSRELVDISAGFNDGAAVHRFADGTGEFAVAAPTSGMADAAMPEGMGEHPPLRVRLERRDHMKLVDTVEPVPPKRREAAADENGDMQVAVLRVHVGDWSQDVVVPFAENAHEKLRQDGWRGGFCTPPGAVGPIQFQLGSTLKPLPVRLTLDAFAAIPYPGAPDAPSSRYLDYRSTITTSGSDDAETGTEVAALNHPIYYDGGRWLFFQAQYDPEPPHRWTVLGVGNRPAVRIMAVGGMMIAVGLLYAFYAKPVIVRRMKERAIAAAAGRRKPAVVEPVEELAGTV